MRLRSRSRYWSPIRLVLCLTITVGLIFFRSSSNNNIYHVADAFTFGISTTRTRRIRQQLLPQKQQQHQQKQQQQKQQSRRLTLPSSLSLSLSLSTSLAMQTDDKTEIDIAENNETYLAIQRGCKFFSLYYDFIDNKQKQKYDIEKEDGELLLLSPVPVVVLHGGPGIPSNYLRPIQDIVIDDNRPVLFWDQLGCGKSDSPSYSESLYSIDLYVNDLIQLLKEVGMTKKHKFHLYGQSFGGILAFEYLKRCQLSSDDDDHPECLSVVLSSTPTDVIQVENEAQILIDNIISNLPKEIDSTNSTIIMEQFRIKHQVQTKQLPKPLQDSYDNAGTEFRGTTAIAGYKAKLDNDNDNKITTPVLIMRGEYDFVTYKCIENWKNLFTNANGDDDGNNEPEVTVLKGCSHHGLLEKPNEYGTILRKFWQQNE
jgi:proline-specific peptidase